MHGPLGHHQSPRASVLARLGGVLIAVIALVAGVVETSASTASEVRPSVRFHPGSPDLHDPLVPGYGNGGYDVRHYNIDLRYNVATGLLSGTTAITARLTRNLSRFNLDFALPVKSVTVNGRSAAFKLQLGHGFYYGKELVITPRSLPKSSTLRVVVRYAAKPQDVKIHGISEWTPTVTGTTAWDDPLAASEWWYPGNDYPSDKATYDVTVTTAKADQAITNGLLVSRTVQGHTATSHWRSRDPMATYLSFLSIGKYNVVRGSILGGTPSYLAYERTGNVYMQRARRDVSRIPEILGVLQKWWGPYPFDVAGAIVSQTQYGTAFETQTRPTFTSLYWKLHPRNVWAVVHEAAHQWYGDSVTMTRWRHVWLAEGFATYTEWQWSQTHGHGSAQQLFIANYQQYGKHDPFWKEPVIHPKFALDAQVYERGAMTLQALRNRVGKSDFFTIMRSWTRHYRHANGGSADFANLAARISGENLTAFFHVWLSSHHRPAPTHRNGFPRRAIDALQTGHFTRPPSFAAIARSDAMLARLSEPSK
jgi:aminopeptidase N